MMEPDWPYQVVVALIDDGAFVGPGIARMARAGALTAAVSGEAADLAAWAQARPRWVDEAGQAYAVMCTWLRPEDAAQIPMLLALACPDGDGTTLVAEAETGRAWAPDLAGGALLGAYDIIASPEGRIVTELEAFAALGLTVPVEAL